MHGPLIVKKILVTYRNKRHLAQIFFSDHKRTIILLELTNKTGLSCDWRHSVLAMRIRKAIPLQAWTGPEISRKLRLPDFKTFGT